MIITAVGFNGVDGYMSQTLIAIDQLVNTLVYSSDDGRFGYADETLSARCWRLQDKSTFWRRGRILVDALFFFDKNHCYESYRSEILKRHLPNEYYSKAVQEYKEK